MKTFKIEDHNNNTIIKTFLVYNHIIFKFPAKNFLKAIKRAIISSRRTTFLHILKNLLIIILNRME